MSFLSNIEVNSNKHRIIMTKMLPDVLLLTFHSLKHRKLLSYAIKTLRYGCDRCADELCKLKLARIGAQRVASDSFYKYL